MNGLMVSVTHADERLLHALLTHRRPLFDALMRVVTRLGNAEIIAPATLALALGAVEGLAEAGVVAAWSLAVSHLVVHVLKRSVCRERPELPVGLSFLITPEDRFSLPSGHATAGLSVALPLATAIGGALGALVLAMGLGVGFSRCYLGVHYPTDVLAGWSLAALTVATVGLVG
jgi:undecaprenyl-diphosphatase